jgi:hypothetical protein
MKGRRAMDGDQMYAAITRSASGSPTGSTP